MSIALPLVDLTGASVGTTGKVYFDSVGVSAGGPSANPAFTTHRPRLNLFNDSKCSILVATIMEGHTDHLTPGAWRTYDLAPGENGFQWTVEAVMNVAAPISQLAATYYFPNENVDGVGALGNSPIGGGVSTSSVQTLSNEGTAAGLLVEDIGDSAFSQLFTIFNDGHSVWAVDQSGVKHQVLKIQLAGNPLQLGQAGDISEVLGQLTVNQAVSLLTTLAVTGVSTFTGNIVANGGENIDTIRDNGTGTPAIDLTNHDGSVKFPQQVNPNKAGTVFNGSVAGSATLWTPIWGLSLKIACITWAGFNSAGGTTFIFPTQFQRGFWGLSNMGGAYTVAFLLGAGAINADIILTLGTASASGGVASAASIHSNSIGGLSSSVDRITISGSGGSTLAGAFFLIGQ